MATTTTATSPRPDEEEDSTPLLGQVTGRDELLVPDPNIYIEVVEAPWDSISQHTAFTARLVISLLMSSLLLWHFTVETLAQRLGIFPFQAMNISWTAQVVYMWLMTYWTYKTTTPAHHASWPSFTPTSPSPTPSSLLIPITFQRFLDITFPSPYYTFKTCAFYSFYTTITLFPICVTILYLTTLLPHMLSHPALHLSIPELLISTLNTPIVLAEILLLNSVTPNTTLLSPRVRALEITFWVVVYVDVWVWLGNAVVEGGRELDWRFLGEGWGQGGFLKTVGWVVGANAVYFGLWWVGVGKGLVMKCLRARKVRGGGRGCGRGRSMESGEAS
ncbi:unnamed protein product [Tuber melanosporum]|uniref:(Perigord truffle) hypothetical protein n=1 Tax=Tuber melanosporum (strain Mel28) TaxID=656061 RepID=D5G8U7_TUBMM|nr:uncharacterized protein GSTUM_00004847001 [Tuber melanosporum]CAZ80940.1 unnamed protein product [Tuber melanosporum]